jgi:DNA segregation ATPase FtsK/SpoIIIE-like protein
MEIELENMETEWHGKAGHGPVSIGEVRSGDAWQGNQIRTYGWLWQCWVSIGSVVFGGMRYGDQIRIYKAKVMLGFSGSGLLRSAQAQLGTALFGKEIKLEHMARFRRAGHAQARYNKLGCCLVR